MLNSTRLVMDAENGLWIEDEDFRVIKAYSSSPRESETTLFLWKNNLSPYERQRTYGRVIRNSPFLENLKVVEGLIERLQRRREHIRALLQTNYGYLEYPRSHSSRDNPALQSCPNLEASRSSTPIIERDERGVSRISIKSRPASLALPFHHGGEGSLKSPSSVLLPPTMNNVHSSPEEEDNTTRGGASYFEDVESISTEYASSTIPIDVDDKDSNHFFSSLEDDSLVFSPDGGEEVVEKRSSFSRATVDDVASSVHPPPLSGRRKTLPPPKNKKEKTTSPPRAASAAAVADERFKHHGVKTHLQDAFYHSTDIIDVDSPYASEDDFKEARNSCYNKLSSFESSSDFELHREKYGRGRESSSSLIKSLGSYTPVYNSPEDRSTWTTPLSSLYSKYFDSSTTSSKGEIQKLF